MISDLIPWLRARYDAREQQLEFVRDFIPESHQGEFVDVDQELRDLNAKRRIVDAYDETIENYGYVKFGDWQSCSDDCPEIVLGEVVKLLALPFADYPGYRDEWRP